MELQVIQDLETLHIRVFNRLKGKGLGLLEQSGLERVDSLKFEQVKNGYLQLIDQVSNEIIRTTKSAVEEIKL